MTQQSLQTTLKTWRAKTPVWSVVNAFASLPLKWRTVFECDVCAREEHFTSEHAELIKWLYRKTNKAESPFTHLWYDLVSQQEMCAYHTAEPYLKSSLKHTFMLGWNDDVWHRLRDKDSTVHLSLLTRRVNFQQEEHVLYLVSCSHWWKAFACCANSWRNLSFSSCLLCSFCSSSSRSYTHLQTERQQQGKIHCKVVATTGNKCKCLRLPEGPILCSFTNSYFYYGCFLENAKML